MKTKLLLVWVLAEACRWFHWANFLGYSCQLTLWSYNLDRKWRTNFWEPHEDEGD